MHLVQQTFLQTPGTIAWRKTLDGTVLSVSPQYQREMGFDPTGCNFRDVLPPALIPLVESLDRAALADGSADQIQEIEDDLWLASEWIAQNGHGPVVCGFAKRLGRFRG